MPSGNLGRIRLNNPYHPCDGGHPDGVEALVGVEGAVQRRRLAPLHPNLRDNFKAKMKAIERISIEFINIIVLANILANIIKLANSNVD